MIERAAFRITPDLRFLYPRPAHEAAFAGLIEAIRRGAGVTLVDGEAGTGKSLLLRRAEVALKLTGRRPRYIPYAELNVAALLDWANSETGYGFPAASVAVLLDDAENCSHEILTGLHDLMANWRGRPHGPQFVLVGGTSLWPRLVRELPELAGLIQTRVTMSPLTVDEIDHYIRHRLGVAGRPVDLFSPDAIAEIARYSRGIPRLVNQVCSRALLLADIEQASTISQQTIAEAIDDCPASALFEHDRTRPAHVPPAHDAVPPAPAAAPGGDELAPPAGPPPADPGKPPGQTGESVPTWLPPAPETAAQPDAVTAVVREPPAGEGAETTPIPAAAGPRRTLHRRKLRFKAPRPDAASDPAGKPESAGKPAAFSGFVPRRAATDLQAAAITPLPAAGERPAFSGFVRRRKGGAMTPAVPAEPAPRRAAPRRRAAAIALVVAALAGGGAVFAARAWPEAVDRAMAAVHEGFGAAAEHARGLYVEIERLLLR